MKTAYLGLILGLVTTLGISACDSGGPAAQNMPVGGAPFTGIFTPGIGNLGMGSTINTCNTAGARNETLIFTVSESGPTIFQDTTLLQNIISGTFTNPVNTNNPCFTGTITYSGCSYAQGGRVTFNGCSVVLLGSGYQFTATYYLYTAQNTLIQSGSVNATK
mgnify:FL=1|jgi:hypothetical protein